MRNVGLGIGWERIAGLERTLGENKRTSRSGRSMWIVEWKWIGGRVWWMREVVEGWWVWYEKKETKNSRALVRSSALTPPGYGVLQWLCVWEGGGMRTVEGKGACLPPYLSSYPSFPLRFFIASFLRLSLGRGKS